MLNIVIGNIIALVASIIMVCSGYIKSKKKIIYMQTIQIGLLVVSNVILGGITGAIINVVGCIRNILCYKDKLNKLVKTIIIILSVVLSVVFNNLGFIGLLPLASTVVYILLMDTKSVVKLKILIIYTMVLWFIYDFYIKSYISACFDIFTIIVNLVAIIQLKKVGQWDGSLVP